MAEIKEGMHAGHRSRMREKFMQYGRDVFHSHELLEMLLFHAVPYKNTNPIAKSLLQRFSTLDGVFSASRDELMTVEGVGPKIADMLISLGRINIESQDDVTNGAEILLFNDYAEVGKFFVEYFSGKFSYEIAILLLNSKMEYIGCSTLYSLDFDSGAIRPEPFIDAAIKSKAAVAVIAHNHPYGPAFPGVGDKATNVMIADALQRSGIFLAEHYIVCGDKFVGFMNNLATAFSQSTDIDKFFESKREETV